MMDLERSGAEMADVKDVERALCAVSARARRALLLSRVFAVFAVLIGAVVFLTLIDYALRFPMWIRLGHFAVGALAILYALRRWALPAWRFRPNATEIALRIEEHEPRLKGLLASAVDFSRAARRGEPANRLTRELEAIVVERAKRAWRNDAAAGLVRAAPPARAGAGFALGLAVVAVFAVAAPSLTRTGALRMLAPWSGAQWPKRTGVADATEIAVHPAGAPLPLRAALTKTNVAPGSADVTVAYRLLKAGEVVASRRELLTWQGRTVAAEDPLSGRAEGELFERLVETTGADAIDYTFRTSDDETPWSRVALVEPPDVRAARADILPPDYAAALLASHDAGARAFRFDDLDMGPGRDERAVAPTALAGSRVQLRLALTKPVPANPGDAAWLARTLGDAVLDAGAVLDIDPDDPTRWTLRFALAKSTRLVVALEDEHGLAAAEESVYRFSAAEDRPPSAAVTEPTSDRTVLPTALVETIAEGRDDVGLTRVWLERQVARPVGAPPSGPGGAIEPEADAEVIATLEAGAARRAETSVGVDLAPLNLNPGDEVWLTAAASDVFAVNGAPREATRSPVRRLRVISEEAFREEVRAALSGVRQAAIRIDDRQAAVQEATRQGDAGDRNRREQAQIGERVDRQRQTLDEAQARVRENRLDDERLDDLIRAARASLERARQRAEEAARRLDEAAEAQERAAEASQGEAGERREEARAQAERAQEEQQRVRDALAQLIEELDRNEDAWVTRNNIEALKREQEALRDQTARLNQETAGRDLEELSSPERSELERIAQKQRELADRARDLKEELARRQEDLRENDPAAAAGLERARRTAEERRVEERMERAAQNAQQNQTGQAQREQEQAIEDLEEILEDIERGEQARDEILMLQLQSLMEALDSLIRSQEGELAGLDGLIEAGGDLTGLDEPMVRLNRNTLGVQDEASASGAELAPVVDLIGQAVRAQTRAIAALRAEAIDAETARTGEEESLDFLTRARDEAKRLQDQLQQQMNDRKKRELRAKYRAALTEQIAVREGTQTIEGAERLSRRERSLARELAQREQGIHDNLRTLREETAELDEFAVFDYAHKKLDTVTDGAAQALRDGLPRSSAPFQDSAVTILQGLVEALAERRPMDEDDFREAQGGGGNGDGSGQQSEQPLIPPIAELRLLRQIQIDLRNRTRFVDNSSDSLVIAGDLGAEQGELQKLGEDLIKKMQPNQAPPGAPGAGPGPGPGGPGPGGGG